MLITVITLAFAGAIAAQDVVIVPDSLDFGNVAIGTSGEPEGNQTLTITNQVDSAVVVYLRGTWDPSWRIEVIQPVAAEARAAIRQIYNATGCYFQDYGEEPETIEELQDLGYLELDEEILRQWNFLWEERNPIWYIVGLSTDRMPGGAGHFVILNLETGRFGGYGGIESATLAAGESRSFTVTFIPEDEQEIRAELDVGWDWPDWRSISLPLHATGYYADMLDVSAESLDFGNVNLLGRGRMELRISNPGRLFTEYRFEFSDPDHFAIHNQLMDDVQTTILAIYEAAIRFNRDHGRDPSYVEERVRDGYVVIPEEVSRKWSIMLIGANPITQIEAVSTAELRGGAGHTILYDIQRREFSGYSGGRVLGVGGEGTYIGEFLPDEEGRVEGTFTITARSQFLLSHTEEIEISLHGNGVLAVNSPQPSPVPEILLLSPAYPNPFNSSTFVSFSIPFYGSARASLRDHSGRRVRSWGLPVTQAGAGRLVIDGTGLSAGPYWLRLEQNGRAAVTRLVLVK